MNEHGNWDEIRKPDAEATLAEKCLELGKVLGLPGAVDELVLLAALEDEDYAQKLLVARNAPAWLELLLANPPAYTVAAPRPKPGSPSNLQLIARATGALLRWGRTGFLSSSLDRLIRREKACLACPHLEAPSKTLQKLAVSSTPSAEPGKATAGKVCAICGCVVAGKMKMPTAECPEADPSRPGFSRWGEALK
ncbi:MAG TPA: hypothetical protein ENJ82_08615 [Bacteroidetes bacterium]|nr:hypothetical protein [Bacteroidota bacterium]